MKQQWDLHELIEHFTLLPPEVKFLGGNASHTHLGKAVLLKFFQYEGCFPESVAELPSALVEYVAQQLNLAEALIYDYGWEGRTIKEHRRQIRSFLGFRPATLADQEHLHDWLTREVLPHEYRLPYLEERAYERLRSLHLEPPTASRMDRLVRSALHEYEQRFFTDTAVRLPEVVKANLQQLIYHKQDLATDVDLTDAEVDDAGLYPLHDLKATSGANGLFQLEWRRA